MTPAPFSLRPALANCPLLITVCHAGRAYSRELLAMARVPERTLAELEDPLVDQLAASARTDGAGLLAANAPRALIDLNRAPNDLDPSAVRGGTRWRPTARARLGLGVLPTRLPGAGALWRTPVPATELERRIADVHAPFHEQTARELAGALDRCGTALLLDLHSMPPLAEGTQVVFGDRNGSSCSSRFAAAAARAAAEHGLSFAFNAPYAGGHVVARHGRPLAGVHALQVELSRDLYLDASGRRPGAGWDATAAFVGALARALIDEVPPMAWQAAAE